MAKIGYVYYGIKFSYTGTITAYKKWAKPPA
jgi:hypothetical protein